MEKRFKGCLFVGILLSSLLNYTVKGNDHGDYMFYQKCRLIGQLLGDCLNIFIRSYMEEHWRNEFRKPHLIIRSSKNKVKKQEMVLPNKAKLKLDAFLADVEYVFKKRKNGNFDICFQIFSFMVRQELVKQCLLSR